MIKPHNTTIIHSYKTFNLIVITGKYRLISYKFINVKLSMHITLFAIINMN